MYKDIGEVYGSFLSLKDHSNIALLCKELLSTKYHDIANFMKLINLNGLVLFSLG